MNARRRRSSASAAATTRACSSPLPGRRRSAVVRGRPGRPRRSARLAAATVAGRGRRSALAGPRGPGPVASGVVCGALAGRPSPPAAGVGATRADARALHRLAEAVISPARAAANGKIGLRYTRGGFGTPFFGADVQLRVAGELLIVQQGEEERAQRIVSLAQAAAHVGAELLPNGLAGSAVAGGDDALALDATAVTFLGDWFGFATSVLEELRASVGDEAEPSRVQLWPEHFDVGRAGLRERRQARGLRRLAGRRAARRAVPVRRAVGRGARRRPVAGERVRRRRAVVRSATRRQLGVRKSARDRAELLRRSPGGSGLGDEAHGQRLHLVEKARFDVAGARRRSPSRESA